jgi:Fe-S-cluster containining protein
MKCDTGCGECCGIAPTTDSEFRRIEAFVQERGVVVVDQGITCPFYQGGRCVIYQVRPLSCRLFGHSEKMACPRGYNTNIPERKIRRAIERGGGAHRVLHEMHGPGWRERLV